MRRQAKSIGNNRSNCHVYACSLIPSTIANVLLNVPELHRRFGDRFGLNTAQVYDGLFQPHLGATMLFNLVKHRVEAAQN